MHRPLRCVLALVAFGCVSVFSGSCSSPQDPEAAFDAHASGFTRQVRTYRAKVTDTRDYNYSSIDRLDVSLPDAFYVDANPTEEVHVAGREFERLHGVMGMWVLLPREIIPYPLNPFQDNHFKYELGSDWRRKIQVSRAASGELDGVKCDAFVLASPASLYRDTFCVTRDHRLLTYVSEDGRGNKLIIEYRDFNAPITITPPSEYVTPTPTPVPPPMFRQ